MKTALSIIQHNLDKTNPRQFNISWHPWLLVIWAQTEPLWVYENANSKSGAVASKWENFDSIQPQTRRTCYHFLQLLNQLLTSEIAYSICSRENGKSEHQVFVQYPRVNLIWLDSKTQSGLKDSKITLFRFFQMDQTTTKYNDTTINCPWS